MKIAEVSKRYGVSTDTLRYYERIGLLRHVPRNGSGIRDYDEASCNAVEFVKCMRDAGMSIESLVEYMELIDQGDSTREARKELLARQSIAIRERIADLERALERLQYKIDHYDDIMADSERALRPAPAGGHPETHDAPGLAPPARGVFLPCSFDSHLRLPVLL